MNTIHSPTGGAQIDLDNLEACARDKYSGGLSLSSVEALALIALARAGQQAGEPITRQGNVLTCATCGMSHKMADPYATGQQTGEPSADGLVARNFETEVAHRLRLHATNAALGQDLLNALTAGANESDRFYRGMVAWKHTAEDKDRIINDLRAQLASERGMADCMDMVRQEFIEAGVIDKSIAPMFVANAVLAKLASAQKDAERYRFLESCWIEKIEHPTEGPVAENYGPSRDADEYNEDALRATIDAARAQLTNPTGN